MRWGLIPLFAKGEPGKYSTINARIETAETAASYRGPWKRGQRCLQVNADEARKVLQQQDPGLMLAHEVSTRVNMPKNNDPSLIVPV